MESKVNVFKSHVQGLENQGLLKLAREIRKTQNKIYGKNNRLAKTFSESRFSSLNHIFKNGLTSCGSMATVLGYGLTAHGYKVKYIHGKNIGSASETRHAWLKVRDKKSGRWVYLDPMKKSFKVSKLSRKKKIYNNWKELKVDYLKGEY